MADVGSKNSENVDGKYYVDDECIACDACCGCAPDFFVMSDEGHAYVAKQPTTDEEIAECEEAMSGCPVDAIGDDGE